MNSWSPLAYIIAAGRHFSTIVYSYQNAKKMQYFIYIFVKTPRHFDFG